MSETNDFTYARLIGPDGQAVDLPEGNLSNLDPQELQVPEGFTLPPLGPYNPETGQFRAVEFYCKSCSCVVPVTAVTCGDCVAARLLEESGPSPAMEPVPDFPASPAQPPRQQHDYLLQFFAYEHLPPHLATISKPFCDLAHALVLGDCVPESGLVTLGAAGLPSNPERTMALRKLLEAKDCAVRALLFKGQD